MNPEYISIYWLFAKLSFSLESQYQTVFIRSNIENQSNLNNFTFFVQNIEVQ